MLTIKFMTKAVEIDYKMIPNVINNNIKKIMGEFNIMNKKGPQNL